MVDALVAKGADVRGFDRQTAPADFPGSDFVVGDICDPEAIGAALDGRDAVFHLAALYSYDRADASRMEQINVGGTRTLLDAALRGAPRRIVHTSSCATCGPVAGRPATEADHPAAWELRVPYKRTKLASEALALSAAQEGADVVVVNPTTPIGPGDSRPTPTGKMVADVAHGRAGAYLARSALNVVAVEDVAAGELLAYERGVAGYRYLLGGENLSMRDVFATIARSAGRRAPRLPIPWSLAYLAAAVADPLLALAGREADLLNLDEVRVGRWPMRFDDGRARRDLGYRSRPAEDALRAATAAALAAS